MNETTEIPGEEISALEQEQHPTADGCYSLRFRLGEQFASGVSRLQNLRVGELVMVQTDHGLEPATVVGKTPPCPGRTEPERLGNHLIIRRASREEGEKFARLLEREEEAFITCRQFIERHGLPMKLIRVERYLNGSKVIFFFTADTRVDFRELVKDLVQEFRTRVEIRQVGVRHETKMIGGLGCCGRELCCSSFIKDFAPVSIKMAKEQGLPLNPTKISGICNRLLCCLTYEYETYHALRKTMPKLGKTITLAEKNYKIVKVNALEETIEVSAMESREKNIVLTREEWTQAGQQARPAQPTEPAPAAPTVSPPAETTRPQPPRQTPGREHQARRKKGRNPKPPEKQ